MRALALVLGLTLASAAARADPHAPADPEARYQALLAAAKAAAPNADWAQLRIAYAERPSFKAFAQSGAKRQMFGAAGDCKVALPAAREVIEETYVDADAHLVAAFCEEQAGQHAAAQLDRDIGSGLIASIQTGDGLSPASAFTPIDVDEEYALMRALGLHVIGQAMVEKDGHSYDVLTADDVKGRRATYYFLIDRILAAERAELAPGAVSEGGPPSRTP